jgi:hypothetical protein
LSADYLDYKKLEEKIQDNFLNLLIDRSLQNAARAPARPEKGRS